MSNVSAPHVLIAGAGHAGGRVAQHLRASGHAGRITLVGDEPHAPYERPALSKEMLVGARSASELTLAPAAFWDDPLSALRVHAGIASIDATGRVAYLNNGKQIGFDVLVIATGGMPRALSVPGFDLPGVTALRTLDDSILLRPQLLPGKRLVVIGGGVIGMEVAASASSLGVQVTVLEAGPRLMSRCLPPEASAWLQQLHESNGVAVRTGLTVTGITRDAAGLSITGIDAAGLHGDFSADLVLVAVGITPNTTFLRDSGVAVDNGVLVGSNCRSPSAMWCYAVGDVANTFSPLYQRYLRQETWRNAEHQARAVAEMIMGRTEPYSEVPWMWTDQFTRNIQVVGVYCQGDIVISRKAFGADSGSMLWLHDGCVAGGVLLDNGRERRQLEALVLRASRIDAETLRNPQVSLKELAAA
jgi:3-phenylpropionate/trans-cinnamate dioxygenase ferredoxin reductase subunit